MTFNTALKVSLICCLIIAFGGCHKTSQITIRSNDPGIVHENGKLLFKGNPFTGVFLQYNSTGDTNLLEFYANGLQEGSSVEFYDNQMVRANRYYHLGKKTGGHLGFWRDGSKRFVYHFKNDIAEGNQKEWTDKGILIRDFNYEKGQESGGQKMWYENGNIRMNYTVLNGRRYGLQGVKDCDTIKSNTVK